MSTVLIVTAAANMILQFNKRNILILQQLGCKVVVATNFEQPGTITGKQVHELQEWLYSNNVAYFQADFDRGIGSFRTNTKVVNQLRKIIRDEDIQLVHAQSPIGGVLGRIAAKMEHRKTIYTAHGFHFFLKAPIQNWVVFYPIEFLLSFLTDTLIVINDEDLKRIRHFPVKSKYKIPGIGIDTQRSVSMNPQERKKIRDEKRAELLLQDDDFVILNVGEINDNKNQQLIIRAMARLQNKKIHLFLAGIGPNADAIRRLSEQLDLSKQVHFLGYRNDIQALHYAADVNVFPSQREGLAMSGLESVVDGLYLIGSAIRGIQDYIPDERIGKVFKSNDLDGLVELIDWAYRHHPRVSDDDVKLLAEFDIKNVDELMSSIYAKMLSQFLHSESTSKEDE